MAATPMLANQHYLENKTYLHLLIFTLNSYNLITHYLILMVVYEALNNG